MHMLSSFLDWFDRHKFGVVGTLMLHTLLMLAFALGKLHSPPARVEPPALVLELEVPPTEPKPEPPNDAQEPASAANVTNRASNSTAEPDAEHPLSRRAQERMAEDIEKDLHEMEHEEFDQLAEKRRAEGKEITVPKLDPSKFDKRNYLDKAPRPVKVEGLTTVSYDLIGRTDQVLEVPAYLCKGQGKVVIRVAVDRSGEVDKAEVDANASTTANACMLDNALSSASSARFSVSAAASQPQHGTITYIFLAQ
jgi:outer membrane biosynthesis protein TonB